MSTYAYRCSHVRHRARGPVQRCSGQTHALRIRRAAGGIGDLGGADGNGAPLGRVHRAPQDGQTARRQVPAIENSGHLSRTSLRRSVISVSMPASSIAWRICAGVKYAGSGTFTRFR